MTAFRPAPVRAGAFRPVPIVAGPFAFGTEAWDPRALGAGLYGWYQPDLASTTTLVTSGIIRIATQINDRAGRGTRLYRADGSVALCPTWVAQSSPGLLRPAVSFASQFYNLRDASGAAVAFGSGGWTFATRGHFASGGGGFLWGFLAQSLFSGIRAQDGQAFFVGDGLTGLTLGTGAPNTVYSVVVTYDGTSTVTLRVNGVEATGHYATFPITAAVMGCRGDAAVPYAGHVSEAVVLSRGLSAAERGSLEAYLLDPLAVPLASAGTVLLLVNGDSLAAGVDAAVPLATRLQGLLQHTRVLVVDFSQSGKTTTTMLAELSSKETFAVTNAVASGSPTVLVALEGINDLTSLQDPTTVYDHLNTYCATVRGYDPSGGCRVLLFDLVPRYGEGSNAIYAGYEADRQAVNASLLAQAGPPYDALLRISQDARFGQLANVQPATYSPDDHAVDGGAPNRAIVHWPAGATGASPTGQGYVAQQLLAPALAALGVT